MGSTETRNVHLALFAFRAWRTEAKISAALGTADELEESFLAASVEDRDEVFRQADELEADGVEALIYGSPDYPQRLISKGRPAAPIIFTKGNQELLHSPGVGMCGSRKATDLGLRAANACGYEVSGRGLVIVSGYAKGVDTKTHLAALRSGGSTIIVLAEGINHFRVKRDFAEDFDPERTLVLSQFPPTQPWAAHAAMARNKLIYGLGEALVVIEAGEKGGTLAAGHGALRMGRPVFVLNFGADTPPGNLELLANGGRPVGSRTELGKALEALAASASHQIALPL